MMKQKIAIKKLDAVVLGPAPAVTYDNTQAAATVATSMLSLGYAPSEQFFRAMASMHEMTLIELHQDVLPVLQELRGAHVEHQPFYPNFPHQVMEASTVELFLNAIIHYWTEGDWKPTYEVLPREYHSEKVKFWEIGLVGEDRFREVFTTLLSSKDSLSEEDKHYIEWFMKNEESLVYPESIPFKENMCVVAGMFIKAGKPIDKLIKTATDVLRVITYLSDGDVSLAQNTKYKSLPRAQRKMFLNLLEKVASSEDIHRHRGKWVRVFHSLHIGEYHKRYPQLYRIVQKIRSNEVIRTYNGRITKALNRGDLDESVALLQRRPGEFARRLDYLLRSFEAYANNIVTSFLEVADSVPTRILLQVAGHFWTRHPKIHTEMQGRGRVVFPKGQLQKARIIPAVKEPLTLESLQMLQNGIDKVLMDRFASMPTLGKVYIDPNLVACPVPSQQRSASEGAYTVARGTRLPFGDAEKTTLRFFIYWVGRDIDLSATLHDKNFKMLERVAYTNLRSGKYQAKHSGDIVNAPDGASEFIDITIDAAAKAGIRYVAMNVLVYAGPNFSDHETCFAGWMTREKPGSNEIYDPKTVEGKVDLRSTSRNAIPAVFDLVERKAIWCDLITPRSVRWARWVGNNVESNQATIEQTLQAIVGANNKVSLHRLFELHGKSRGELVETPEEADTIFSLHQGVTPYDINRINSEFLA